MKRLTHDTGYAVGAANSLARRAEVLNGVYVRLTQIEDELKSISSNEPGIQLVQEIKEYIKTNVNL